MKCLQSPPRILFVSAVLAGSLPAGNLMNLKLTAEHWRDAIPRKRCKPQMHLFMRVHKHMLMYMPSYAMILIFLFIYFLVFS